MKKILFVLTFLVIITNSIFCQNTDGEKKDKIFTLQTSPILFLRSLNTFGPNHNIFLDMDLEGQYKLNDIFNLSFTISFLIVSSDNPDYYTENEISLKPMFIYRPFRTGLKGFYIGLYPTIGWLSSKNRENDLYTIIGFGLNTGYKWIFKNGFTLQLGTGIGKSWFIPEMPLLNKFSNGNGIYLMTSDFRTIMKSIDLYLIDLKLGYSF
jgi:hypothetical protein